MSDKISIVTPIYRDSYIAEDFVLSCVKEKENGLPIFEIIFVVDGSGKEDEILIQALTKRYPFVKSLLLSRNFGQHIALSAGYKESTGDYVCMINVDQQDPVTEIKKLFDYQKQNNLDITYGLRNQRKDGFLKVLTSNLYNITLNKLTGDNTPLNVATIRIMSRRFVDAYNSLCENTRYIPGLEFWLGFERGYVKIDHQERLKGESSYNFSKRLTMAVESIISFSDLPLRWTAIMGMLISLIGFIVICVLLVLKLYLVDFQSGYISTIALILFLGGIQIFVVGMASVYIGRVLKEVQNRPLYIIKDKLNFK